MEAHQKDALMQFFRAAGQSERLKILGLTANRASTTPELADKFEVNKRYTEAGVIDVLQRHFHKQEMLRRYLLDARLLKQAGGVYWRPAPAAGGDDV